VEALPKLYFQLFRDIEMLHIVGMGSAHPDEFLTNEFITNLDVGTNSEWIEAKIGIKTRVTSLKKEYIHETKNSDPTQSIKFATSDAVKLGVEAAKTAIKEGQIDPKEIGYVFSNSCNPAQTSPSLAVRVAKKLYEDLGVDYAGEALEVTSACPGFALHMNFLNSLKIDKLPKYNLCFDSSTVTQSVDYNDRTDGAIWGDGAAAWIVSPTVSKGLKIVETTFDADPTRCNAVVIDRFKHFHQDGRAVRDFSVRQTVRMVKKIELQHEIDWSKDIFIGHQANRTMLEQVVNNRKIPPTNHWHNVSSYGNQGGAGAPAVLAQNWHKLKVGQKVVVAVVGAGLSWGSVVMEFVG
jgi:3-oxoacyl-[acyl-carrier-protein] synthase III